MFMRVAVSKAISFSCPPLSAKTSVCARVRVRPAFTTRRHDAFACGRSEEVDLEFRGQNAGVSGHQA
jgi:hypothetical protein